MLRGSTLLIVGAMLVAAACTPQREPDLSTIQSNTDAVHEGDFGALLQHMYQAEKKAEYAEDAKAKIEAQPGYLFTDWPLRQSAVQASAEAVEQRKEAEAALDRFLDPLRARIAYLESLHVPQGTGVFTQDILFPTGSDRIPQDEIGKIEQVAQFLTDYPISAVTITGYADTQGDAVANKDLSRRRAATVVEALRGFGVPLASTVAVEGMGEAEGPDNTAEAANRRVTITVEAHGKHVGN
jgi:outer membrane protein OmpA-like peptidoglycan-associated protein